MRPYIVRQGDYLEKIAHALGVDPDEVWNDPRNAELKKQRDPDVLSPGDILYVPDAKTKWLPLAVGANNLYVAKVPRTKVRLVIKDVDRPRAGEEYTVEGMGEVEHGTTDGEGGIEVSVPVHVREIQITFTKDGVTYPVHIGDMDPIEEPSGVRKRLRHLGVYAPDPDEVEGADARGILIYQRTRGLPPTGTLDDATKAALAKEHGS